MNQPIRIAATLAFLALANDAGAGPNVERVEVPVRGKTLSLAVYRPDTPHPRGTVIMASGDVGWVGLAVNMAEFLRADGYLVAGVNVRQYLSAFTERKSHLMPEQVAGDYLAIRDSLAARHLLAPPVVVSGVSEGAAVAVLAASDEANHAWIAGVISMGLPTSAELAWRWSDFTTWITKKDANEPSFAPKDFIAAVSPVPMCMIQSTRDEYVPEAGYRDLESAARNPKRLVLIEADNHRFSNRLPELRREYSAVLSAIPSGSCR
jgi:dienelactone hydrolase